MKDIQNTKGDYRFKIDKVGVSSVIHPINVRTREGNFIPTIGNFSMDVSLGSSLKGINMSRLTILLSELNEDSWSMKNLKDYLFGVLGAMRDRMESEDSYISMEFNFFREKKAPVSGFKGLMPYKCIAEGNLNRENKYDFILTVEVPITTLCPCSKEISDYSAHNQRGYVTVSIRSRKIVWIEEIIDLVESIGSCDLYPILKRVDEKYVTERAYENPRFVEDIVRMAAERLYDDERIVWFKVGSRHQESIHPHDAYAVIEMGKE